MIKMVIKLLWFLFCFMNARQMVVPLEFYITSNLSEKKIVSNKWNIDIVGYYQHAKADTNEHSLAKLFFGKSRFMPQQAHYNQQSNPLFPFADQLLTPRLSFSEKACVTTIAYEHIIDSEWSCGFEIAVPWKEIEVKKKDLQGNGSSLLGGQTLDDVLIQDTSNSIGDFALNLGFALKLPTNGVGPGLQIPLVNLSNQAYGNQPTIGPVLITDMLFNQIDQNPITILKNTTQPQPLFFVPIGLGTNPSPDTARGLPTLDSIGTVNGLAIENGQRARFGDSISYSGLSDQKEFISQAWLVPSVTDAAPHVLTNRAQIIKKTVNSLFKYLAKTPEQEFEQAGLSFANSIQRGLGDISISLYCAYSYNDLSRIMFKTGVLVPSGRKLSKSDSAKLFVISNSSNGHVQPFFKVGADHFFNEFLSCYGDTGFLWAIPACESIPASFSGAGVKNCGPLTKADISWSTIFFRGGFFFKIPLFCPVKPFIDCSYQCYYKSNDYINFLYQKSYDWAGNLQPLSDLVAGRNSNSLAHIIFINSGIAIKSYGSIQCGWQSIVGGFNTITSNGWMMQLKLVF